MNDKISGRRKPPRSQEGQFCYRYPHAAIAADCVIFGFDGKGLKILLIERGNEPFKDYWALPGGFMRIDETIEEAAARELEEETNLSNVYLEQFKVYSTVKRDPRERVVSIAFIALVKPEDCMVIAGDDAAKAVWYDEDRLPALAFDHALIIREAREYLKDMLYHKPIAFELLSKTFTLSQLQTVYEVINQATYDRRNFMRTAIEADVITEAKGKPSFSAGRNVKLYQRSEDLEEAENSIPDYQRLPSPPGEITVDMKDNSFSQSIVSSAHSVPKACEYSDENFITFSESEFSSDPKFSATSKDAPKRMAPKKKNAPTKGLFGFFKKKSKDDTDDIW